MIFHNLSKTKMYLYMVGIKSNEIVVGIQTVLKQKKMFSLSLSDTLQMGKPIQSLKKLYTIYFSQNAEGLLNCTKKIVILSQKSCSRD